MSVVAREKIKGSGIWWLFINHGGKRKSKKIGTDKEEAKRLAKILEGRLAAGDIGVFENRQVVKPFSYYCEQWIITGMPVKKKGGLKASTKQDYRSIYNKHMKGASFYQTPVDRITENDVEGFLTDKRKTRARSTVGHLKNLLSNVFQKAMKDRVIKVNPCAGAVIGEPDEQKEFESKPFNQAEINKLLEVFKGSPYYQMVLFLCRTGCRIGEILPLTWGDINLSKRKAHIHRSVVRNKPVASTKNGKDRKVDLTPLLVAELRKLKLKNQGKNEHVFLSEAGNRVNMNNFRRRVWYPTLEENNMRRTRLHDLRHSFASLVICLTKDIFYASKMLGHSSIQITCDRYGHLIDDESETRGVDILDAPTCTLSAPKREKILNG